MVESWRVAGMPRSDRSWRRALHILAPIRYAMGGSTLCDKDGKAGGGIAHMLNAIVGTEAEAKPARAIGETGYFGLHNAQHGQRTV